MRFELGLRSPIQSARSSAPSPSRASYIAGGLIPLAPYVVTAYLKNMRIGTALLFSVGLTLVALFVFGFVKGASPALPLRSLCKQL